MIRKLKSGEYRLYSRKKDPKTKSEDTSGRLAAAPQPRSTSGRSNSSSAGKRRVADARRVRHIGSRAWVTSSNGATPDG